MARRRYLFDPPDRFVAGTIGRPGDRTFFLQARDGQRVVSIVLEKVQVAVLADRLGDLLAELERRGVEDAAEDANGLVDDTGPLDEPINEAFRAGSLTLGWDVDDELVLVEARAQSEDGPGSSPPADRRARYAERRSIPRATSARGATGTTSTEERLSRPSR
jgi:uncharacterized repeat protein (TIGR03847 family)